MMIDTRRVGSWLARAFWYAATVAALILAFVFVMNANAFQQAQVEIGVYQAKAIGALAELLKGHST
jgi:hypothetical protein